MHIVAVIYHLLERKRNSFGNNSQRVTQACVCVCVARSDDDFVNSGLWADLRGY